MHSTHQFYSGGFVQRTHSCVIKIACDHYLPSCSGVETWLGSGLRGSGDKVG